MALVTHSVAAGRTCRLAAYFRIDKSHSRNELARSREDAKLHDSEWEDSLKSLFLRSLLAMAVTASLNVQGFAETIPTAALPTYQLFRSSLLKAGWIPDFNYGNKSDDGSPMYRFPEVSCGNKLCSAQWVAKIDRRRVVVILWRDSKGGYRVAPQIEFPG
jgi:hypothetical protein